MQLAATGHLDALGIIGFFDSQGDVVDYLTLETFEYFTAGHETPFKSGKRRVGNLEGHGHGGFVNSESRQRLGICRITQRIGNPKLVDAGDRYDVAGLGHITRFPLEPLKSEHLKDTATAVTAMSVDDGDILIGRDSTAVNAADPDCAYIA